MNSINQKKAYLEIDKDQLYKLNFAQHEVLKKPKRIQERKRKIKVAVANSKGTDNKVSILFHSAQRGLLKVRTSVLTAGQDFIVLKGGYIMPIQCIRKVGF